VLKNGLRHFGLKWAFTVNTRHLGDTYDTIILSGDCLSAVPHFTEKRVIYYCHTIPRYLFDQREEYEKKVPKIMLYVYQFMTSRFKKAYLRNLVKIKTLLTNSKNTQKRIKFFTGMDADILYPPVDTDFFCPKPSVNSEEVKAKNYFLSFARLSSIKRVDRIVKAFQELPNEKLIITYGKNDPDRKNITALVKNYQNIEMRLSPSDTELRELIR
jgi:glycosyltransferase involved in cell wall biosynthesis